MLDLITNALGILRGIFVSFIAIILIVWFIDVLLAKNRSK